jgi:hypothetical protein
VSASISIAVALVALVLPLPGAEEALVLAPAAKP